MAIIDQIGHRHFQPINGFAVHMKIKMKKEKKRKKNRSLPSFFLQQYTPSPHCPESLINFPFLWPPLAQQYPLLFWALHSQILIDSPSLWPLLSKTHNNIATWQ